MPWIISFQSISQPCILFIFLYLYFNIKKKIERSKTEWNEIYEKEYLSIFLFFLLKFNLFFNCLYIFEFERKDKRRRRNPLLLWARNEHFVNETVDRYTTWHTRGLFLWNCRKKKLEWVVNFQTFLLLGCEGAFWNWEFYQSLSTFEILSDCLETKESRDINQIKSNDTCQHFENNV